MADPRHMLTDKADFNINGAKYAAKKADAALHLANVTIEGVTYPVCMLDINLIIDTPNQHSQADYLPCLCSQPSQHSNKTGALVDQCANGGIAGADCHVIKHMDQFINVEGIDNHVMKQHLLVTAGGITNSNRGPIILIMHQYALAGKGTSDIFQDYVVQVCEKLVIFCNFWSCKLATVSPQTGTVHST